MKIHYIVTRPFLGHKRGDIINDPAVVATLKRGPYQHNVVRAIERPEHANGSFWKTDAELHPEHNGA